MIRLLTHALPPSVNLRTRSSRKKAANPPSTDDVSLDVEYDTQHHTGAEDFPDQVHLKQSQEGSVRAQTERERSRHGRRPRSPSREPVAGRKGSTLLKDESKTGKIHNLLDY